MGVTHQARQPVCSTGWRLDKQQAASTDAYLTQRKFARRYLRAMMLT